MGAKFLKNVEMFLFGKYKKGRFSMRKNQWERNSEICAKINGSKIRDIA